ncbi:MAG: hypothetical protein KDK97_16460, partial [Verrucomicrobiales bacterium]|nr:hypothetical protein [Verrucomicrobiales bacterium]
LDASLLQSTFSQLLTGTEWREEAAGTVEGAGLPQMANHFGLGPTVGSFMLALAAGLALAGWVILWRKQPLSRWLACTVAAGILFATITRVAETYFYPRFVIALVPAIVIGWGAVLSRRLLLGAPGLVFLGFLFLPGWQLFTTRPYAPLRDAAEWIQQHGGPSPVVLAYGHGREAYAVYDPQCHQIETLDQLESELAAAKAQNRLVFVVLGHNSFNRALLASGYKLLDDPARFEEIAHFTGIESEHYFRIFEAR